MNFIIFSFSLGYDVMDLYNKLKSHDAYNILRDNLIVILKSTSPFHSPIARLFIIQAGFFLFAYLFIYLFLMQSFGGNKSLREKKN